MSGISSVYNSITRMTGLSGLDVDGMVQSLMQLERTKVDKVSQSRQALLWKQEKYRSITSALQSFNNEYFNSLKLATDMRNPSTYSAFAAKYNGADSSSYFNVTAGAGAKSGEYTVSNVLTALTAKVTGTSVADTIEGTALTSSGIQTISSANGNNVIRVVLNGIAKDISIKESPQDIDDLQNDLQSKFNTAFGTGRVVVGISGDKLTFKTNNTKPDLSSTDAFWIDTGSGSTALAALGLTGVNTSNKIDLNANIYNIRNNFATKLTALTEDNSDNDISFTINGQTFNFNSSETTLSEIITSVNSNTAANVKMSYDGTNNKFLLESKTTGATSTITTSDTSGGFLGSLGLIATDEKGRDASLTFNDGINGDQVVARSTNNLSVGGITFNLKKDNAGPINLSLSADPAKAMDLIKGFVTKYNDLIDKVNAMIGEERNYDYEPLTDSQKEAMSEDQIKEWETKAKTGLLAGDGLLRSIVTNMRNAMVESVEGAGITLSSIGIKSSSWLDKGKLYIDENKLKTALNENPDQVVALFTNTSNVTYSEAAQDSSKRTERFNESGLISRISDIIQNNIRTTSINDQRGALLEKAGMTGDRSLYSNMLYSQISEYDKKIARLNDQLAAKENSYYSQFAQLETLINNMNSQSNWLAQQFK